MLSEDIAVDKRDIYMIVGAGIATILNLALLITAVVLLIGQVNKAAVTYSAVCSLRANLIQQVLSSEHFLTLHPKGIPGITSAQINSSINREKVTINSLTILNCPAQQGTV